MEPIVVKTKSDEKEYAAFFTDLNAKGFRANLILGVTALALAVLIVFFELGGHLGFWEILFLVLAAAYLLYAAMGQYRMRRLARSVSDAVGENEKVYSFGADGFVCESSWKHGMSRREYGYECIERVRELKDYILIVENSNRVFGLKKADVPEDMLPRVRALISKKLPQEKYEVVS
jgi:Ca2+/Na+ antiporter